MRASRIQSRCVEEADIMARDMDVVARAALHHGSRGLMRLNAPSFPAREHRVGCGSDVGVVDSPRMKRLLMWRAANCASSASVIVDEETHEETRDNYGVRQAIARFGCLPETCPASSLRTAASNGGVQPTAGKRAAVLRKTETECDVISLPRSISSVLF